MSPPEIMDILRQIKMNIYMRGPDFHPGMSRDDCLNMLCLMIRIIITPVMNYS